MVRRCNLPKAQRIPRRIDYRRLTRKPHAEIITDRNLYRPGQP